MQYLGGKSKIRRQVAAVLESLREGKEYLEPFVGGGWILQEVAGIRTASDSNKALITMYNSLLQGWLPPETVTEEEYAKHKETQDSSDPMTAFVGFACSFGGKWYAGYARQKGYNFAAGGRRALQRQLPKIATARFVACDYREWKPKGKLIYCDPPYCGVTGYKEPFDSEFFWSTMREWAKSNTVVVSEYAAPKDFYCIREFPTKTILRDSGGNPLLTTEKLFCYRGE